MQCENCGVLEGEAVCKECVSPEIEALNAELSRLREENDNERWRTWEEEMPGPGRDIRVCNVGDNFAESVWFVDDVGHLLFLKDGEDAWNLEEMMDTYTHWRPAAQPPEES